MNVYEHIKNEEASFKANYITVVDGYEWNLYDHVRTTILYRDFNLKNGKTDFTPVKNIIRPILNLEFRATGFDVKDIAPFVNDKDEYYKSFLIKKYHEIWAAENNIDEFIDRLVETYVTFGGALVKKTNKSVKPEVVPWQIVAFCDQTDVMSGDICLKHSYSPSQLREMSDVWDNVEDLIVLSENQKTPVGATKPNKTPGKYIEIYELHTVLPESELPGDDEDKKYVPQLHIVGFYKDEKGKDEGITLFKGKELESPFRFIARDEIYGRALGMGGAEELFESQVWTNYSEIRKIQLLDASSKIIFKATDPNFSNRNKIRDMENMEIMTVSQGDVMQLDTTPRSMALFDKSIVDWEAHAQMMASANESILGESPSSGTPFKLQELVTAESHSLHEYRKGKIANFVAELYRDWFIPDMKKRITSGTSFLSEIDLDDLTQVADNMVNQMANDIIKEKILSGELVNPDEIEEMKRVQRERFMSAGNKRFVEILKGEFKKSKIDVDVNIVGKQKYIASMVDKLVNVMRQLISNPQALDDPRVAKIYNQILEYSGFSPIDYGVPNTRKQVEEAPPESRAPVSQQLANLPVI